MEQIVAVDLVGNSKIDSDPETMRSRAVWYRLIAGAFIEEPSKEYIEALRNLDCIDMLSEHGVSFDDDFLASDACELNEDLACEYTSLFASSGGFPPIESVRMEGGYQQQSMSDVKGDYRSEGFVVGKGKFHLFDDQLGVELEFLASLIERQADAIEKNDADEAKRLNRSIRRFWVKHPGRWVRGFGELIAEASEHSFYREMAVLLKVFADAELLLLGINMDDDDGGHYRLPKKDFMSQQEGAAGMTCGGG